MRRLTILVASIALALTAVVGFASPAEAHGQPYDNPPYSGNEHNLCVWFRPYGVGAVIGHYRYTGTHRQCLVCIGGDIYAYEIQYWEGAGWTGPWDTTLITSGGC